MGVMKVCKFLVVLMFCAVSYVAYGAPLTGTANVNMTSDTAATAKTMAFDEARRQIIVDALSPYADLSALRGAVANEKSSVLANLIASSGITNEKSSDTAYSATINMTVDRVAAKRWMAENNIQNWLNITEDAGDRFLVEANLENKLADWSQIRRVASDAGIDLNTESIYGNRILFRVQSSRRGALTIALRDAGWKYQDRDGVLYVFK
jgi:hypothetical protein